MDGLRWLLLLCGLLVVAGVYAYSRRERNKLAPAADDLRLAPTLRARPDPSDNDDDVANTDVAGESVDSAAPVGKVAQKIVTLRLVARDRSAFRGDDLVLGLREIGMRHGRFGIFHRYDGNDESSTVFSAASLVEPGSFDLKNIKDQEIPGISFFMVLPGTMDGAEAFDMMMESARTLARSLSADLLDESGSTLSIQRERYMREEVIQFQHSLKRG